MKHGLDNSVKKVVRWIQPYPGLLAILFLFTGCTGRPLTTEQAARGELATVAGRYRAEDAKPELPVLTAESGLDAYLRFAMFTNPGVEAAYYEWAASVERITTARSLPDPRAMFESDIADTVMTLMPGLMMDLPGPGKLRAAGNAAAAESEGRYFVFEREILRTAFAVKSAYYRLHFLEENLKVQRETLTLLGELEQLAQQQNAAGRGSLQDVLRAQIEQEQIQTQIENLEDSRGVLLAEFKAALGLGIGEADPPVPVKFTPSAEAPDREAILQTALRRNPEIQQMAADVRRAQAMLDLARKSGVPDFSFGLEADVKAGPTMWRPSVGMTLPIWRDKIAAEIAAAHAQRKSAQARFTGEQIQVAAELAAMLYMYRESVRNADLLEPRLLLKGRQSLEAARAGYAAGKTDFLDVIDSYRQLLGFEQGLIEAKTQRELSLASLSLLIAGVQPGGSPALRSDERANEKEIHP